MHPFLPYLPAPLALDVTRATPRGTRFLRQVEEILRACRNAPVLPAPGSRQAEYHAGVRTEIARQMAPLAKRLPLYLAQHGFQGYAAAVQKGPIYLQGDRGSPYPAVQVSAVSPLRDALEVLVGLSPSDEYEVQATRRLQGDKKPELLTALGSYTNAATLAGMGPEEISDPSYLFRESWLESLLPRWSLKLSTTHVGLSQGDRKLLAVLVQMGLTYFLEDTTLAYVALPQSGAREAFEIRKAPPLRWVDALPYRALLVQHTSQGDLDNQARVTLQRTPRGDWRVESIVHTAIGWKLLPRPEPDSEFSATWAENLEGIAEEMAAVILAATAASRGVAPPTPTRTATPPRVRTPVPEGPRAGQALTRTDLSHLPLGTLVQDRVSDSEVRYYIRDQRTSGEPLYVRLRRDTDGTVLSDPGVPPERLTIIQNGGRGVTVAATPVLDAGGNPDWPMTLSAADGGPPLRSFLDVPPPPASPPASAVPTRVDEEYTGKVAKFFGRLKASIGVESSRQNYKGTGSKRADRQIWVRFTNGAVIDVWITEDNVHFAGVVVSGGKGRVPRPILYGDQTPAQVFHAIERALATWAGVDLPPEPSAPVRPATPAPRVATPAPRAATPAPPVTARPRTPAPSAQATLERVVETHLPGARIQETQQGVYQIRQKGWTATATRKMGGHWHVQVWGLTHEAAGFADALVWLATMTELDPELVEVNDVHQLGLSKESSLGDIFVQARPRVEGVLKGLLGIPHGVTSDPRLQAAWNLYGGAAISGWLTHRGYETGPGFSGLWMRWEPGNVSLPDPFGVQEEDWRTEATLTAALNRVAPFYTPWSVTAARSGHVGEWNVKITSPTLSAAQPGFAATGSGKTRIAALQNAVQNHNLWKAVWKDRLSGPFGANLERLREALLPLSARTQPPSEQRVERGDGGVDPRPLMEMPVGTIVLIRGRDNVDRQFTKRSMPDSADTNVWHNPATGMQASNDLGSYRVMFKPQPSYFVSAQRAGNTAGGVLLSGPYATKEQAEGDVNRVRSLVYRYFSSDPQAAFAGYGVAEGPSDAMTVFLLGGEINPAWEARAAAPSGPTMITVHTKRSVNRMTAPLASLLADYKARGLDDQGAWRELIKDRGLSPEIDFKELRDIYATATAPARLLVGEDTKEEVPWEATHFDTVTEKYVMVTPKESGGWRTIWATGYHGGDPPGPLPERYRPIGLEAFDLTRLDDYQQRQLRAVLSGEVITGDDRLLDAWQEARNTSEPDPLSSITSVPNPERLGTRSTYLIAYKDAWKHSPHAAAWAERRKDTSAVEDGLPKAAQEDPPVRDKDLLYLLYTLKQFDGYPARIPWTEVGPYTRAAVDRGFLLRQDIGKRLHWQTTEAGKAFLAKTWTDSYSLELGWRAAVEARTAITDATLHGDEWRFRIIDLNMVAARISDELRGSERQDLLAYILETQTRAEQGPPTPPPGSRVPNPTPSAPRSPAPGAPAPRRAATPAPTGLSTGADKPVDTPRVFPWVAGVLDAAEQALGVTLDRNPLGMGANGQVFAVVGDHRALVVKITAEEKEVRGLLRLQERAPRRVPKVHAVVPLGTVDRPPDYADDPTESYAILREAVTPISDAEAAALLTAWTGPKVERETIATRLKAHGVRLYDWEDHKEQRGWTPQYGQMLPPYWWADNAAFALNYWLHQPSSGAVKRARVQVLQEYAGWLGMIAGTFSHPGQPPHPLTSLLVASQGPGEVLQGAFCDFGLGNLGRNVKGDLVWFDIHWVDLAPKPIATVLSEAFPSVPAPVSAPRPPTSAKGPRVPHIPPPTLPRTSARGPKDIVGRATLYEVVVTDGTQAYLLAYVARNNYAGILEALQKRGPATLRVVYAGAPEGRSDKVDKIDNPVGYRFKGAPSWYVLLTGRTQRDMMASGLVYAYIEELSEPAAPPEDRPTKASPGDWVITMDGNDLKIYRATGAGEGKYVARVANIMESRRIQALGAHPDRQGASRFAEAPDFTLTRTFGGKTLPVGADGLVRRYLPQVGFPVKEQEHVWLRTSASTLTLAPRLPGAHASGFATGHVADAPAPKRAATPRPAPAPRPRVAVEGCQDHTFEWQGRTVRVTCGSAGKASVWNNIQVSGGPKKLFYGWDGSRWARNEVPEKALLRAIREEGILAFPAGT